MDGCHMPTMRTTGFFGPALGKLSFDILRKPGVAQPARPETRPAIKRSVKHPRSQAPPGNAMQGRLRLTRIDIPLRSVISRGRASTARPSQPEPRYQHRDVLGPRAPCAARSVVL